MIKRRVFLLFILASIFIKPYAQVNLQTGSAVFSLPMFNWNDDKSRLSSIVALSYSSGNGLNVNSVASNVGQGWNIVAGGVISRLQIGGPDDQVENPGSNGGGDMDITKYPPGILHASMPADDGCPEALTKYPIFKSQNQVYAQHNVLAEDKELDYFNFQFNGKAGMFVLDPEDPGVGHSIGDTKMKITYQQDYGLISQGIRTSITSFQVQDVDGLIYKFTVHGKTKVLRANYFDKNFIEKQTQPDFESGKVYRMAGFETTEIVNPYIISSWYLSEIEDALTHRKIYFNYQTRDINTTAGMDISYNKEKNYSIITFKNSITKTPDITSIVYPDGHTVTFNYGDDRIDLGGAKVLASVDITYQGRYLSKYLLNTSYFIKNRYGTPISGNQKKLARLCLLSVQKIGVDLKEDTPPYIFDYYMGSSIADDYVPSPFSYARDIWGFYNGTNSVSYNSTAISLTTSITDLTNDELKGLCFLRDAGGGSFTTDYFNSKSGYAKNGLLKQIVYPTGGTLTYEYTQNAGLIGGNNYTIGGVHVSKTLSTDGGSSNGCNNPIATNYDFVVNGTGSASSLWGIEMPVNSLVTNSHYEMEKRIFKFSLSCLACCDWKYKYPGILFQQQSVDIPNFQKIMNIVAPVLGAISIISTIVDIATLIGTAVPGVGTIVAVIIDVVCIVVTIILSCTSDNQANDETATIYYNADLNGISPLPAQFKRVEVTESPGGIGKTIQEFTSDDDYAIWEPTNPTFSAKQRFAPWAYGLPKKTTVLDNNGYKVKETENEYNFNLVYGSYHPCTAVEHYDRTKLLKQPLNILSCKCQVKKTTSQRNTHWSDPNIYNDPNSYHTTSVTGIMDVDIYDLYTGRTELYKTHEKIYKPNSSTDYAETVTEYVYNDENYEVSMIKTTNSDGTENIKDIYYSIDYVIIHGACYTITEPPVYNTVINTLVNNNMISVPVETNMRSSTYNYISDRATIFTQLANGDIKPDSIIEARFEEPTSRTPFWGHDGENYSYHFPQPLFNPDVPDHSFFKAIQTFTYDASGNLIGVKDEGDRQVANIYDYNDKYVIASVINADPLTDKSAYTSFETASFGGWSLSGGGAVYVDNSGVTGLLSLSLTGRTLSRTIITSQGYTLSFWKSGSTVTVNGGASLAKSGPTINGFTYYEYNIAPGTSSVSVSGNASVDELRLYPQTARMSTTTYDPLIGKTAECDVNNRITYYEYDNLGRLRFIKDENKNIVKMYEYNNVSAAKQNGCPTVYYNRLVSETFTKNDCGTGYLGSEVTYTIAANTYSSTVSQFVADMLANLQLLTYGQAYANTNGSCIQLYYNTVQSQNFTTQNCEDGDIGGTVTYTVPANKYYSTASQADANNMALEEIAANGQAYANDPANANCTTDTNPYWEWEYGEPSYCLSVNGQLPPHLFVLATDINPNSSSYNQTSWQDAGPNDACPAGNYYNSTQSGQFTRNNCGSGYTGSTVTYTVPAGTYSSTTSQAAANQLAQNDVYANGQSYANANGTCTPSCSFSMHSGYSPAYTNISNSGGTVSFYLVFYPTSGTMYMNSTYGVATINGGCAPSTTKTMTIYDSGRTYFVTIYSSGWVDVQVTSGGDVNVYDTVGLSGSYTQ